LLEEVGHAAVTDERAGRKLFMLTADGTAALAASRDVLDAILARITSSAAARGGPPPQILRAIENLTTVIRLRLQGEPADAALILAISGAIDAAARTVEEA
jgi:hypothetical protein